MAGVYIHIPFCKRRCAYCDFFSTTLLERRDEYIEALLREASERKHETSEPIRTIYIGGGTPSILETNQIERIVRLFDTLDTEEITMELNPGDATQTYLHQLRATGVNRLSIGIQSFQNNLLRLIGRRHNAQEAMEAVQMAQEAGFDNLSVDLMYALPTQTQSQWQEDIETALGLGVQHISSYGLMYEEGTPLTRMRDEGQIVPIDEDEENAMYDYLCERLKQAGFVHYEVSNFALPGYESKHNSNYWNHTPYIGLGAGAHSLNGNIRSWNPDNLDTYIKGIMAHNLQRENETLSERDLYNEKIMLGLRTSKGIDPQPVNMLLHNGREIIAEMTNSLKLLRHTEEGRIAATPKGLHVLNRIIEELMID